MLVVVEGPDGSGKSTLINVLRSEASARGAYAICLRTSRPRNEMDIIQYLNGIAWLTAYAIDVICDRFSPISEAVYGYILRGKERRPNIAEFGEVNLIVYCHTDRWRMKDRLAENPQLAGVAEKFDQIANAYEVLFDYLRLHVKVIDYDYADDSPRKILNEIYGEAK